KSAQKLFGELYARALKSDAVPAVDERFYHAMVADASIEDDRWTPLLRDTARQMIEKKGRLAVVYLAWQTHQLGDPTLADNLLTLALDDVPEAERFLIHLAAIDYLSKTAQLERADELVRGLLAEEKHHK